MTIPTEFNGVMPTILKQYVGSQKLIAWLELFHKEISVDDFLNSFYDNVWNLDTANTYGLNIWGKIVDLPRTMTYQSNEKFFGFKEALIDGTPTATDPQPFDQAPFYSAKYINSGQIVLTDEYYRKAIYMKAAANITNCTVSNINRMLMYMFGSSGHAWVQQDGANKMSYHFAFTPSDIELAIIQNANVLPRPSGAIISYIVEV